MAKKKSTYDDSSLFQVVNDDPRLAKTVDVSDTIDTNIEDLFTVVGTNNDRAEKLETAPYSYWKLTFKHLFKKPMVIVCLALLVIIIFFTIFGTMMRNFPPVKLDGVLIEFPNRFGEDVDNNMLGPNSTNWFGVCAAYMGNIYKGADLWYCVWKGSQLSLLLGTTIALITTTLGIVIGSAWGYFRWLDPILIEFRNFVNNVPTILLDILLMQIFRPYMKQYGFLIIVLLISALGWLGTASFMRNQIIIIRNREYNVASQTLGTSSKNMITHNLLPYLVGIIVTACSGAIPGAISAEVGLSYFDLSFKMSDGYITLGQVLTAVTSSTEWMSAKGLYLLIAPLVVMAPLTISFFYIGNAFADSCDPKAHR